MSEINWTVFDFMQPRNWVECLLEPACGGISFFFRSMNLSKSSCEFPNYEWTLNYSKEYPMAERFSGRLKTAVCMPVVSF